MMNLTPERAGGGQTENAAGASPRRDFLKAGAAAAAVAGGGLGAFYFGYEKAVGSPCPRRRHRHRRRGQRAAGRHQSQLYRGPGDRRHPPLQRLAGLPRRLVQRSCHDGPPG